MNSKRKALSLIEVMVTSAIFSIILIFLNTLSHNSLQLSRKNEASSDVTTEAALLVARMRSEFRGAILIDEQPDQLQYRHPRSDLDSSLLLGSSGELETELCSISVQEHAVVRTAELRRNLTLGRLGSAGSIQFTRIRSDLIKAEIHIVQDDQGNLDRRASQDLVANFYFPNQP